MKKKKTAGRDEPNFRNDAFKSLKAIKGSVHSPSEKTTPKQVKHEPAEEAGDLFLRAMSGVRKMDEEPVNRPEPEKKERVQAAHVLKPDEQQFFLQAMQKMGTVLRKAEPEMELPARQSASSRMKQLRRGTIRIGQELDLHGLFRDDALVRLEHFISAAYGRGDKAVLVITGKGINSPEGPVLQGVVSEWLREKSRQMVAEFAPAPRDRGGSGAFVVFLKSR